MLRLIEPLLALTTVTVAGDADAVFVDAGSARWQAAGARRAAPSRHGTA